MKRLIYLLSAVAILFSGCDKVEEKPESGQEVGGSTTEIKALPEFIYASVTDEQGANTRTFVDENKKVLWQNGDAVSYFYDATHNARYTYNGEDGKSSVELSLDNDKKGTTGALLLKSHAVYPYNENITAEYVSEEGIDKVYLTFPTTQQYGVNSFGKNANIMVAVGKNNTDDDLYFRNACGYLVIKLYAPEVNGKPTKIKSLTLSSVSGMDKIAGAATVVQDTFPQITMADDASSSVTLDCSNGGEGVTLGTSAQEATAFWFCLPPVTFTDGIKIIATDVNNNSFTKQTSKTVEIIRNEVQPMAALSFVSNTPAATKLWYTRAEGNQTVLGLKADAFDAPIKSHGWDANVQKIVIEFESQVTTIKEFAFEETDIATITLPEGFTTIKESAFEDAEYLSEITIPGSVTSIGVNAFYDCANLESVTFLPSETNTPLNICHMAYGANWGPFYDTKLTYINLNRELNYVDEKGNPYIASDDNEGMFHHKNYGSVEKTTVILGPQVRTLLYKMFQSLPIEEITIPGTVTTIENNVFEACTKLKHLTFEPSANGSALTMGYDDIDSDDGPFVYSPLESINLNREINYSFDGYDIDTDDEGLFGGKATLTSVTLGEQVKTLSDHMFAASAISEIVIPGSVNTIGDDVFHQCTSLTKVTFEPSEDGSPLTMGYDTDGEDENLFQDNNALTTLVLNREIIQTQTGVDTNSEGLFGGMSTLASITLGEQVKTLTPYMFAGSSIEAFVIPGNVTSIANNVFDACSNLKTITFEPSEEGTTLAIGYSGGSSLFASTPLEKVTLDRELNYLFPSNDLNDAAEGLFGNKSTLTSVTLGDNVKTLSPYMFAKSGITTLNLNKVETIADNALANLALTSLTIPGNVMTIGNSVFANCDKLASLTFEPNSDGKELSINSNAGFGPFYHCPLTTLNLNRELKYSIPGVDGSGLFGAKTELTKVTLGDQVKTLSPHMFAGSGITSLDLNKVETIQTRALARLAMTSLTIPGNVMTIENNVFEGCKSLAELVFLPHSEGEALKLGFYDNATDDDGPFYDCPLTTVKLNRELDYTFPLSDLNDPDEGVFGNKTNLVNLTLGEQLKTLSPYMFSGLPITELSISASVTEIKDYAFYNCEKLANLTFESGADDLVIGFQPGINEHGPFYQSPLTNIVVNRSLVLSDAYATACDATDEGVFSTEHGSQNTTISLGGQVGKIPEFMFASLPLTSIIIPATVTEISNDAFTNCDKLTSVIFEEGAETLTIGYNTIGDDEGLFAESPLTSVALFRKINYTFPNPNTASEGLFGNKETLTSIIIGNNVTELLPYMFANSAATSFDLKQVTTIGEAALMGADFTDLTIPACVTSIGNYAFADCENLANLTIASSADDLFIGFQPGTDQRGPFYQSPLKSIKLNRPIAMTSEYNTNCDQWDEGIFSNEYYNDNVDWTTDLVLGPNVKTILKYMFSGTRIQQLHIPETVDYIGLKVIENCEKLNAIIFYDEEVRPELAFDAFGERTTSVGGIVISGPPGNGQYYVFVPYRLGRLGSSRGELYYTTDDLMNETYWDVLHGIMVDDQPDIDGYNQPHKYNESRYLDVEGYEWYRKRYYDRETITPPVF